MLWHIGNTTVRTPYRLREALQALAGSSLNGNIDGEDQQKQFAYLLKREGIVNIKRDKADSNVSDLGRKWRAALSQLGFITPKFTGAILNGKMDPQLLALSEDIPELSGRPFEITPNGYRLMQAEEITFQQECFLRSLVVYRIPTIIEKRYKCKSFSPLKYIIDVLRELETLKAGVFLSFKEFALFVQTSTPENGIDSVINKILHYRAEREKQKGKIKKFEQKLYDDISLTIGRKPETLNDYADLSLRYLRATGLFSRKRRGITFTSSHLQLSELLRREKEKDLSDKEYFENLWRGAKLPIDEKGASLQIVKDLISQLRNKGCQEDFSFDETSVENIDKKRHELEDYLLKMEEQEYADIQCKPENIDEIDAWLQAILGKGKAKTRSGEEVSVPKGERPAYLEWIIWRTFLALDSLCNFPWEARRFKIDQDFFPVSHAPGGGPDMVFEFKEFILVVEVTLSTSSRQEAVEGEPVRRHVAEFVEREKKEVYGLFIAKEIDTNTAHTFRYGDWYLRGDKKISLAIVPIELEDFHKFFCFGNARLSEMPLMLSEILMKCRVKANEEAPKWKASIKKIIGDFTESHN